jgi:hypothetical protein
MKVMLLNLSPFGFGHIRALKAIASPCLTGKSLPDYEDLLKAVVICAHKSNKVPKFDGWFFRLKLKLWLRRMCRARRLNWSAETLKLQIHIEAGLRQLLDSIETENAARRSSL